MRVYDNGIYRDMTAEEIEALRIEPSHEQKIAELKQKLADTNDKAIEYAEGFILEEDYAPIRAQRQEWREEINKLEG